MDLIRTLEGFKNRAAGSGNLSFNDIVALLDVLKDVSEVVESPVTEATIDISGLTSIDLSDYPNTGIFNLTNTDLYPLNIDNIINAPTNISFELRPVSPISTTFRESSVSGGNIHIETIDNLVLNGAKGDFVKFRRIGSDIYLENVRKYYS